MGQGRYGKKKPLCCTALSVGCCGTAERHEINMCAASMLPPPCHPVEYILTPVLYVEHGRLNTECCDLYLAPVSP
jgi:hypothetical protein